MLRRDPRYRRLKVDGRGAFASASYWIGPDHLLIVEMTGYAERYHRFAFADIQALVIRETSARLWLNNFLGVLSGSFLLAVVLIYFNHPGAGMSSDAIVGASVCLALTVAFAILFTVNLRRGPTCVCHLQTAVQTRRLPCLGRWRKAELLLRELTPLLLAAQRQGGAAPTQTGPASAQTGLSDG